MNFFSVHLSSLISLTLSGAFVAAATGIGEMISCECTHNITGSHSLQPH